jgi:acylphosphatase
MKTGLQIVVTGRVQGVGFRWFVQQTARQNEIMGSVENMPNGDVEIFAEGEQSRLMEFLAVVRRGPAQALVTDLVVSNYPFSGKFQSFKILH